MDYPSVLTVENSYRCSLSVMFSRDKKNLPRVSVCKTVGVPSVGGFFICDRISDGKGNYRQLVYRRTKAVGETVGNNFTDGIIPSVKLFNGVV